MSPSPVDPSLERSFRGHKDAINSLCFNPNMRQLVSGGNDGCVMVWNFKLQLRAFRFVGHKEAVLSVAAAPSGNLIASGSKDRTVRLWLPTVKLHHTCKHTETAPPANFHHLARRQVSLHQLVLHTDALQIRHR